MNVPFKWLKQFVDIDITAEELARRLTLAGLEAEKLTRIGAEWDKVFVGEVLDVQPHPDADRLVLADVEAGEHRLIVVTGAPNIVKGQKVALALAGARLVDAYADEYKLKTLKPGKIRGIESQGMVCSEKELGLSEEHEGILILESDAPAGMPLADWLGDTVIEFEITPNLVHAFSMLGIARETGAVLNQPLKDLPLADLSAVPVADNLVTIADPILCPRYAGIVIDGIEIAPSPAWLAQRLTAAGLRPINNIVDITNYIMLEIGQPTHAFDLEFIKSGTILVRTANGPEKIETLDHVEREVPDGALLITDGGHPVAIAGVMGGVNSEVLDTTTSILLEIANFEMRSVRHTARAIKLRTDASARYERGIGPELVELAYRRAVQLILECCPNASVRIMRDVYPMPPVARTIDLPVKRIAALLGMEIPIDQSLDVLTRLGFELEFNETTDTIHVTVPSWRSDVSIQADIIEEIARIVGYQNLPATLPSGPIPAPARDPQYLFERDVREVLVNAGLYEVRGYITNSDAQLEQWSLGPGLPSFGVEIGDARLVHLKNAIPAANDILRTSIVPNLATTVIENLKHERSVRVFEVGHCFYGSDQDHLPISPPVLAIAIAGRRDPFDRFGANHTEDLDYTDLKGIVDQILVRFRCERALFTPYVHPALHPARSAEIHVGDSRIGIVSEVLPTVSRNLGIEDHRLVIAELDLSVLAQLAMDQPVRPIQVRRFLPVEQDFAVIVAAETPAAQVEEALRLGAGPLATEVVLFDVFEGEQIGENRKSLAYRVTFTAPDRALTDAELGKVRAKIEKTLARNVQGALRA